jgi:hypothetical protein
MDNLCRQPIQNPVILYKKTVTAEAIICEGLVNYSECDCGPNEARACFFIVVENGQVVSQN